MAGPDNSLQLLARFLRQVIDVDPNFIFAKDREGRFTLVNQAVAEAYGTTVEELIGKTDADFNPNPEEVEHFRKDDLEVMDTLEERFIPEETITDASGRTRWLQTVKRPLLDEDGTANQVLGSATDITARKEAEEAVRALAGKLLTAQEDERRRLAREMHDDLTQRLAALSVQAGRLERLIESPSKDVSELVSGMAEGLRSLSADVHTLSRSLHPAILEDLGLADALAAECDTFREREAIVVELGLENVPDDLPTDVALCFYRIAQEALRNVAKHSTARTARVSLRTEDGALVLRVTDDGKGFDTTCRSTRQGLGLASMDERARLVRAAFSGESRPGSGTTVRVRVPLA